MNWNWLFRMVLFGPLLRLVFRVHVVGAENLPRTGPFIIAPGSHTTEIESAIIAAYFPKYTIRFFAKAEYWKEATLKGRLVAWFMTKTGQIPLERTDARSADESINKGAAILRDGGIIAIYPEGTRSKDGKLHKGRTGVARTAIRGGGVLIVPVGLIGMEKLNPPGGGIRPGMATIVVGKPINPYHPFHYQEPIAHPGTGKVAEHTLSRIVTDALMKEIARLSIKEYSSEYLSAPR